MKIKVQQQQPAAAAVAGAEPALVLPMMPRCVAQLVPSMLSVLKAIEPEVLFSGYDGSTPDTSSRLMSTLNRLGGQQVVSAVKWAKSLPGEASGEAQCRKWVATLEGEKSVFIAAGLTSRGQSSSRQQFILLPVLDWWLQYFQWPPGGDNAALLH